MFILANKLNCPEINNDIDSNGKISICAVTAKSKFNKQPLKTIQTLCKVSFPVRALGDSVELDYPIPKIGKHRNPTMSKLLK